MSSSALPSLGGGFSAGVDVLISNRKVQDYDTFTKILAPHDRPGLFMVFKTQPPVALALGIRYPSTIDWMTVLTLEGGTVGATSLLGAHRSSTRA
jgi:hypothetical protein